MSDIHLLLYRGSKVERECIETLLEENEISTYIKNVSDLQSLHELIDGKFWTLVLCFLDSISDLGWFLDLIQRTNGNRNVVPMVAVVDAEDEIIYRQLVNHSGVHDILEKTNLRRLPLIINREFEEMSLRDRETLSRLAFKKMHKLFRNTFDLGSVGLAIASLELDLVRVNHRFAEILGYEVQELEGMNLDQLRHDDAYSLLENEDFLKLFNSNTNRFSSDRTVLRKDGANIVIHKSAVCVRHGDGEPDYLLLAIEDFTERVKEHQLLEIALDDARLANRTKSQFLTVMNHELRTPLNAILGFAELLYDAPTEVERTQFFEYIQKSSNDLLRLLDCSMDYLDMNSGIVETENQPFLLSELTNDLEAHYQWITRRAGLGFQIISDPALPDWIVGDKKRLYQVLDNLLNNAIKFTGNGDVCLRISIEKDMKPDKGKCSLHFSVSDTGVGIPEERLKTIFEEFSQLDSSITRRYEGIGLGLSYSQKIIHLMGGNIKCHSEPGKGSEFFFNLDFELPQEAETHVDTPTSKSPPDNLKALRIICAEDNQTNRAVLKLNLGKMGFSCKIVPNGAQLLAALQKDTPKYDLIFMDIVMPHIDGLEATRLIRKGSAGSIYQDVYVVGLTASALAENITDCLNAGMNDCLRKPVTSRKLFESIKRCNRGMSSKSHLTI